MKYIYNSIDFEQKQDDLIAKESECVHSQS